jgi:hypothetical protein
MLTFSQLIYSNNDNIENETVKANMYVISIGINKYNGFTEFKNCVNDAKGLLEKVKKDNEFSYSDKTVHYKMRDRTRVTIKETFAYGFYDENATIENVRSAFKTIIKNSKPNDYFVLFYAGMSFSIENVESAFVLYQEEKINFDNPASNRIIKISELASLMNQISSNNQLVISESCYGQSSSKKLMSYMFEDNPIIASAYERNRIIITVSDKGFDSSECDRSHAPLASYILKNGNLIHAFKNINSYEFDLQKSQLECPVNNSAYFIVRQESDFTDLLINNYNKSNSRGAIAKSIIKQNSKGKEHNKTYAFIIATDIYNKNQKSWGDLKNPINDAEAVSKLLKEKYDVDLIKVYNNTKNEILKEFIKLKNKIGKNDKLIFFVAGHGYYSDEMSDGFLVLNDSQSLEDDPSFGSYLPMATLNKLLDGVPCKQSFTIFDVCFGSSFDLNADDVKLSNYSKMNTDLSIDEFIERKEKYISRIFLASGKSEVPDHWDNSLNHSPFANKLIDFLKKEKEFISPSKIFAVIEANITEPIMKSYGSHEERGDFIIKVSKTK